ncbi:dienelactone hydrolase family protein [Flavobacterium sp. W21_SRS_FM6]|uniref:dienelactone hydrolase family protein n=1 Tax=Flavobacterium sp. W21_SRS_FM6 TaxID=3240268 RepID=UPI003F9200C9
MRNKNVAKIPQQAFDWYDEYAHGDIDRRTFLSRLASLSVVGLTLGTLTQALTPNYALAEQVSFNDPDITAQYHEFLSPHGHGKGRGYLVTPKQLDKKLPGVLVVHENRGLNPYIEDVARRLAKQGYIAFAPDALFPVGGYPGNDDEGRALQRELERSKIEQDFIAGAGFLKNHELANGKLGVVGFCFGAYISNYLAAAVPELIHAAVPFYGTPASDDLVKHVKAPILLQFAEQDKRVNDTWPQYKSVLEANKVKFQAFTYPGTQHGFHNDSTSRYDAAAAELAWERTLHFFASHLVG